MSMQPIRTAPTDGSYIRVICHGDNTVYRARMSFYREERRWFVPGFPEPHGHWGATPIFWRQETPAERATAQYGSNPNYPVNSATKEQLSFGDGCPAPWYAQEAFAYRMRHTPTAHHSSGQYA